MLDQVCYDKVHLLINMGLPTISREEQRARIGLSGTKRIVLSFYRYVHFKDPTGFCEKLRQEWSTLGCLGRIYIATEGINAQLSVPEHVWQKFDALVQLIPELAGVPYKFAAEGGAVSAFYKLTVKVRNKIVADGLDDDVFDVTKTGAYLTATEFNKYIDDPAAVVVDMRNSYESEVGHFTGAIIPDVDTFKTGLQVLPELLRVHKNKKIALYCTGGIRCEKASAWLLHHDFTNVCHLKGGIIDYKHQVESKGLSNKFRGKNFVFDERLGERIGNEVIATCHLCQTRSADTHYHCRNKTCHILFIGCEACVAGKRGYCSYRCLGFDRLPGRVKKFLTRHHHQKPLPQFKKHRLRLDFKKPTPQTRFRCYDFRLNKLEILMLYFTLKNSRVKESIQTKK